LYSQDLGFYLTSLSAMLSKGSINKLDILKVPTAEAAAMTLTAHLQNLDQMTRSKASIQRHDPTGPKTPSFQA